MGLLDVFNGMQNGPRGNAGSSGGMSPITMALLGLLAYKAVKGFGGSAAPAGSAPAASGGGFGGLGDLFRGGSAASGMGGGLGAGGIGGLLTGGLGDLLKQFQGAGKGDVAESWVGTGQNRPIAPTELNKVLTPEQIEFLTARTGLSREELLAGLSDQLPKAIDHLTPDGRLPTPEEMNRAV
ncbi:MAG: YidB family protein [Reyranella sp.]